MVRSFLVVGALVSIAVLAGCLGGSDPKATEALPSLPFSSILDPSGDVAAIVDVVGGNLSETPEAIVAEIYLRSIDSETFNAARASHSFLFWNLCWNPIQHEFSSPLIPAQSECAGVMVAFGNGVADVKGYFELGVKPEAGCNDWWWCNWRVPYKVIAGSPGTLHIEVPKYLLPNNTAGATLEDPIIWGWGVQRDTTFSGVLGDRRAYAGATTPVASRNVYVPNLPTVVREETKVGPSFNLTSAGPAAPGAAPGLLVTDPAGDVGGGAEGRRADLDILGVEIAESATGLTLGYKVGSLLAAPTHDFYASLGLGPHVYDIWYEARAGVAMPQAGYCVDTDCNQYKMFTPTLRLQPGTPGLIQIVLPRSSMGPLPAGTAINLVDSYLDDPSTTVFRSAPGASVRASVSSTGDWASYAHPAWLQLDS